MERLSSRPPTRRPAAGREEPRLKLRMSGRGATAKGALRANFGRDGGENRDGRHRPGS